MMHSRAHVKMFLKSLTLWFSRSKYCLSLEMALSVKPLMCKVSSAFQVHEL